MSWYVVYTQPTKENVAALNLHNQGFKVYLPRHRRRRRHARRVDTVLAPLFPRYLFVNIDRETQRWRAINGTLGVAYLLTEGSEPLPIPTEIVESIQAREDDGIVKIMPPAYRHGQRVCVTDGPFADLEGVFECVDDEQRVVLLLEFMGRVVRTRFPGHAVSAA